MYNFAIDVSGTPCKRVIVGCVAFSTSDFNKIINTFRKKFKTLQKKKASDLDPRILQNMLSELNRLNLKMVAIEFETNDWAYYKQKYKSTSYFDEKIFAILYFLLLKTNAWQKKNYPLVLCNENFMNIEQVKTYLSKISKANKFYFDISIGSHKSNYQLKFPDLVAGAVRKLDKNILKEFKNLKIIPMSIPSELLSKLQFKN